MTKEEIIKYLNLSPHPEGGWYRQVYHSKTTIPSSLDQQRYFYTSIYFLLDYSSPSHFHRLKHDEIWYYHGGTPIDIHIISSTGTYSKIVLGNDLSQGEHLQYMVPAGSIFGSEVNTHDNYSLVSCAVSPGFDYQDFEIFTQQQLLAKYPKYHNIIKKLAYKTLPN